MPAMGSGGCATYRRARRRTRIGERTRSPTRSICAGRPRTSGRSSRSCALCSPRHRGIRALAPFDRAGPGATSPNGTRSGAPFREYAVTGRGPARSREGKGGVQLRRGLDRSFSLGALSGNPLSAARRRRGRAQDPRDRCQLDQGCSAALPGAREHDLSRFGDPRLRCCPCSFPRPRDAALLRVRLRRRESLQPARAPLLRFGQRRHDLERARARARYEASPVTSPRRRSPRRPSSGSSPIPRASSSIFRPRTTLSSPLVEAMYDLAGARTQAQASPALWILTNAAAAVSARGRPSGAVGRFFDGPPPRTKTTIWQANGGLAILIAAAALDPTGRISPANPWAGARYVSDRHRERAPHR